MWLKKLKALCHGHFISDLKGKEAEVINEVKNKTPSITNLVINSALNAKINEVKIKIHSITNLATTALTAVE